MHLCDSSLRRGIGERRRPSPWQLDIRDAFPLRIHFRRRVRVNEEPLTVSSASDGDGNMEIVVGSSYYEAEEITIYRCDPKKG
jgi:hypothetical protein